SLNQRILGPALRIGFHRVDEETIERGEKVGKEQLQTELHRDLRCFGGNVVVAVRQCFAETIDSGRSAGAFTKRFQSSELFLKLFLGQPVYILAVFGYTTCRLTAKAWEMFDPAKTLMVE